MNSGQQNRKRVLLVEDDAGLCELMSDFFLENGFALEAAHDGRKGLARALEGTFDIVLLDVMLPFLDGFELLRNLRQRSAVPVIMLTARTENGDRILGLETGADDYLPKPFDPQELLARIRAVLRRTGHTTIAAERTLIEAGALSVNPIARQAWHHGQLLDLTSIEFDILQLLARSAGRVVTRDVIATALYQRESSPFERSLDVHISHLRKKLDQGDDLPIKTVRGVGYMLADSAGELA